MFPVPFFLRISGTSCCFPRQVFLYILSFLVFVQFYVYFSLMGISFCFLGLLLIHKSFLFFFLLCLFAIFKIKKFWSFCNFYFILLYSYMFYDVIEFQWISCELKFWTVRCSGQLYVDAFHLWFWFWYPLTGDLIVLIRVFDD